MRKGHWQFGVPWAAAGFAMENVTFYRKHQAAMQKMGESAKAADCSDE